MAIPIGPLITLGTTLAGLFAGRGRKDEGTIDQTITDQVTPSLPGEAIPLRDLLIKQFLGNLGAPIDLNEESLRDIELQEAQNINKISDSLGRNINAGLRQRGLSFSPGPVSNTAIGLESFRGQQLGDLSRRIAETRFQLPALRETIQQNRFGGASRFLSSLPRSIDSTRRITGTNINRTGGNKIGGAIGGFSEGLLTNLLLGNNPFGRNKQPVAPV